jgi:cytochrome c55X
MPGKPLQLFWFTILVLAYSDLARSEKSVEGIIAPPPTRQAELLNFVRQDCGSCHGLRLEGGLGTPLTPTALAGKPTEALVDTILHGRTGTAMPPWEPFLTESEAGWIVQMLQKGLP